MKKAHQIHQLCFDITHHERSGESEGIATWIQERLLPLIEQSFEEYGPTRSIKRIPKLELDLGPVTKQQAEEELLRQLKVHLSQELSAIPELSNTLTHISSTNQYQKTDADHASSSELSTQLAHMKKSATISDSPLQLFLLSGQIAWENTLHHQVAHQKILQQALQTRAGIRNILDSLQHATSLERIIKQYRTPQLLQLCRALLSQSNTQDSETILDLLSLELVQNEAPTNVAKYSAETFWRWVLPITAIPNITLTQFIQALTQYKAQPLAAILDAYQILVKQGKNMSNATQKALQMQVTQITQYLTKTMRAQALNTGLTKATSFSTQRTKIWPETNVTTNATTNATTNVTTNAIT
ncbi:MAG: hypothetical protein K2P84_03475, partial [Undibacterium sp.]|nr:hypothetical protein [Undibacterium sp.]